MDSLDRRSFVRGSLCLGAAGMPLSFLASCKSEEPVPGPTGGGAARASTGELFTISLAQWSLHLELQSGELDPMDFPATTKSMGIDAVEYVNSFYGNRVDEPGFGAELKQRCDDAGVQSLLIMCDGLGHLGDSGEFERKRAVENHRPWLDLAQQLGCHSIRVNARSSGSRDEQLDRAADGLHQLCEVADGHGLNVLVENHGGLSSDGSWLSDVMRRVDHPRVGTLPDFGNFDLGGGQTYDRYQGVEELMPFAKAVSAKSHDFDAGGKEIHTDYHRMLKIVVDAGYRGFVGIEYEGSELPERVGIERTFDLLVRVRAELSA
ncbi:MAG: sugar phosphate isomerase/epimerase family protein [Planctomycetota bacterium]